MTLRQRKEIINCVPWVKKVSDSALIDCEARTTRNQPCKLWARWIFKTLDGTVYHFCFPHLIYSGFDGWSKESDRFDRWWKRNKSRFVNDDSGQVVEPPE
jgi:hypothetical protein